MPQSNTDSTHTPRPFARLSIEQLIARMNRAADFGYDDESEELDRRLSPTARAWRWSQSDPPRVEIYTLAATTTTEKAE
jgi:hypothetical protein